MTPPPPTIMRSAILSVTIPDFLPFSFVSPVVCDSSQHHALLTLLYLLSLCSEDALQRCKRSIEIMANSLGLEGFSRIDAFVNVRSGEV